MRKKRKREIGNTIINNYRQRSINSESNTLMYVEINDFNLNKKTPKIEYNSKDLFQSKKKS